MASLKDIKRRIGSVKSTQKITNAMKLVSASKFSKANHAVQASRPYGRALDQMVETIVGSGGEELSSPLLRSPAGDGVLVIVVGSDRGLCGGMNTNVFKKMDAFLASEELSSKQVTLVGWGRRAIQYVAKKSVTAGEGVEKVLADPSYENAQKLGDMVLHAFRSGKYSQIHIAFPRFKSALEQIPTVKKLLPFTMDKEDLAATRDMIIEPEAGLVVERLVERWLMSSIHRVLLEGAASEHGARMSAMDSATNNAKEVQKKLTLVYNRARQAAITTELTEIISGAEALN